MTKKDEKKNKILFFIFLVFGLMLFLILGGYLFVQSSKTFEYKGIKFEKIQEGELTFYNTQVPVYSRFGEKILDYNFYLRTDPREMGEFELEKDLELYKILVLNYSEDLNCQGYGMIALTNIINLYELFGTKITVDKNATCDETGKYMFLNLKKSDETSLKKIRENCYEITINNCDIFPPTEKFMVETLVKLRQENILAISSA